MDWLKLLNEIFQLCIIPLLGVLTSFVGFMENNAKIGFKANQIKPIINTFLFLLRKYIKTEAKKQDNNAICNNA